VSIHKTQAGRRAFTTYIESRSRGMGAGMSKSITSFVVWYVCDDAPITVASSKDGSSDASSLNLTASSPSVPSPPSVTIYHESNMRSGLPPNDSVIVAPSTVSDPLASPARHSGPRP